MSFFGPLAPYVGLCVAGVFDAGSPVLPDAGAGDAGHDATHD
jgi:hypothetical protein